MEMFTAAMDLLKLGLTALGGFTLLGGIIMWASGHSSSNSAEKDRGMAVMVGGGVILAAAQIILPMIKLS